MGPFSPMHLILVALYGCRAVGEQIGREDDKDLLPHNREALRRIANATYAKVLPCLNDAWMMDTWKRNESWAFPDDAEEHYKDLTQKAARFRRAPIHNYAGYAGTVAHL
jgi:hypothetical protein